MLTLFLFRYLSVVCRTVKKFPTFILERGKIKIVNFDGAHTTITTNVVRSAWEVCTRARTWTTKERRTLDSGPHRKQKTKSFARDKKETFREIHRHVNRSSRGRSEKGHVEQKQSGMALTTALLTSKKEGEISGV